VESFCETKENAAACGKVLQTYNKPLLFNPNFAFSLTPTKQSIHTPTLATSNTTNG